MNTTRKLNTNKLKFNYLTKRSYTTNNTGSPVVNNGRLSEIIKNINLNPVYIYDDLNLETTKNKILRDTKDLSGVYMIINKTTQDYYIGSAATNRFYPRFSNHLIYFRGSKIVKLAVKKYRIENFGFVILELYPNIVTKENNLELLHLEDKYLKLLLPNYNILTEAGFSFGYKHTEIDRKKMQDIYSVERRQQIGDLNRGKTLSEYTIEKIREIEERNKDKVNKRNEKEIRNVKYFWLLNLINERKEN